MKSYPFTLVISGDLENESVIDALFEAGCDDATLGTVDGVGYADFFREAPTLAEALRSAIDEVESVHGLRVLRIEPDDFVTMKEIADRLGRSRESIRLLIRGERGPGEFPPPRSHLKARTRLWKWSDVISWIRNVGLEVPEQFTQDEQSAFLVAAFNAALTLRVDIERLDESEQDTVQSFLRAVA